MGASPTQAEISRKLKAIQKKTGEPCVVLRASNGEVAIVTKSYLDSCKK